MQMSLANNGLPNVGKTPMGLVGQSLNLVAAYTEYNQARTAYYQALHNFENADHAFIDAAIKELSATEMRMDIALIKLKELQLGDTSQRFVSWSNDDLRKGLMESGYGTRDSYLIGLEIDRRRMEEKNHAN
jgi:hypothetical protein